MHSENLKREKWTKVKLAHTREQRERIMACIRRLNSREARAIDAAVLWQGSGKLPRPHLRAELRQWFRLRWVYLLSEYEKILPHVEELEDAAAVKEIIRGHLMRLDGGEL